MSLLDFQKTIGAKPDGIFGKETLTKAKNYYLLTNEQTAHFFGQVSHETGVFKVFEENLRYSSSRLLIIFKHDFDINRNRVLEAEEKLKANTLSYNPQAIANFVYANQNGNGNEASGDGWKYRGRGALQLTGKSNYIAFSKFIKDPCIVEAPDLVAYKYCFDSAIYYFTKNKIWDKATKIDNSTIATVTRIVNGGINGLSHRADLTKKYYKLLTEK